MFRKLRLRLVLVNLTVIVVLFLILTSGTYFFVQHRMARGNEHLFNMVADDLLSGRMNDLPPEPPGPKHDPNHGPGPIFFARLDMIGNVVQVSSVTSLPKEVVILLAEQAYHGDQCKDEIFYHDRAYTYRIVTISNNQGHYVIFHDVQNEYNLLRLLVMGLSIAGVICIFLSFFGSLFMANRAMIPIKRAWQQQNDFLADASHELRTPLAVIQTNLELVRDNPLETVESQDKWLNNIYEETMSMTRLVTSLLFLARADSKQMALSKAMFSLDKAVRAAVEPFEPVAAVHHIRLDVEIKRESEYFGDEAKLRQVVAILLDNAIRYTSSGGLITVTLASEPGELVLSVADTGTGIAPEQLRDIFRRFYQADKSRTHGGAGLGLSIAKWIVEKHQGTIAVNSSLGEGSVFKIRLPVKGKKAV